VQDSKFWGNIDTLLLAVICGEVTGFDEGGKWPSKWMQRFTTTIINKKTATAVIRFYKKQMTLGSIPFVWAM